MLRYRINQPTVALVHEENRYTAQTVATGAIITVVESESLNQNELIKATWGEASVMMYAKDLRTRCKLVPAGQKACQIS